MKTKPILFNDDMIRALLDGRKTQTRRVAQLTDAGHVKEVRGHRRWHPADENAVQACPYGQPGDLLWVRETHAVCYTGYHTQDGPVTKTHTHFKADEPESGPWTPSILMPRWASRITLHITDVRVQRVQDISEDDALSEGVNPEMLHAAVLNLDNPLPDSPFVGAFAYVWNSINADNGYSWKLNPWVWALTFEVIHQNIDDVVSPETEPRP